MHAVAQQLDSLAVSADAINWCLQLEMKLAESGAMTIEPLALPLSFISADALGLCHACKPCHPLHEACR